MEEKYYCTPSAPFANSPGIIMATRDLPPAHYLFKINSFSLFAEAKLIEKYESGVFEAGGYKWKLLLYPNGNKNSNGEGYISLYLQIAETEKLPSGWQINVNFKFFVFDQIRDKYLTIEDAGAVKRFHQTKTEWGFDHLLNLKCFKDTTNGYLVNDSCILGAEVFVIEQKAILEDVSMIKQLRTDNSISFKIKIFSKLRKEYYVSPLQTIAGFKWKLLVYPYGNPYAKSPVKGTALSLYLGLEAWGVPQCKRGLMDLISCRCSGSAKASGVPPKRGLYVKYKLRLMNQISSNHLESTNQCLFNKVKYLGYHDFVLLKDLQDASKGFLVKDALTVQAEILLISCLN